MIYFLNTILFVSLALAAATTAVLSHVDKELQGMKIALTNEF